MSGKINRHKRHAATIAFYIILLIQSGTLLWSCSSTPSSAGEFKILDSPQQLAEFRAAPMDLDAPFLREPLIEEGVYQFGKGDTFLGVLNHLGAPTSAAKEVAFSLKDRCALNQISCGSELPYTLIEGRGIRKFSFPCGVYEVLHVEFDGETPVVNIEQIPHTEKERVYVSKVRNNSSMISSAIKDGISERQVMNLAKVFRSDIDFNNDVHVGDELRLWVREIQDDAGNTLDDGEILAALFVLNGKEYWGIHYEGKDGKGFFDKHGKSLRKSFLKSPLPFLRVTSGFTLRRFHPVLGKYRPHMGVDFGAPTGTPVMAAADGKVIYAGKLGGYGNVIKISHGRSLMTLYAHLSKILVKTGQYVKQGKVIGKVGATGLATGPHLHYGMYKGNKAVDPMSVKMETTSMVTSQAFREHRDKAVKLLSDPKPGDVPMEMFNAEKPNAAIP